VDICHEDKKMIYYFNNTPIFYTTTGSGEPLVLLHGFLESSTIWKDIITALKNKYTIIALDLPGHGKSGNISEIHSMELMAEVLHGLLEYLGISKSKLVGHSMGGYVALAFTERFPAAVDTLVLLNSTSISDSLERKENRDRALRIIESEKKSFIGMAIVNLFSTETRILFPAEIESLKKEAYSFSTEGISANIRGMKDRLDRTSILKNFPGHKWVVAGTQDPIVPISHAKELAFDTNSHLKIVEGSHMSWLENQDEIVNFMLFIDFFYT
jgi:pimeloyl-ACP methyl ester carboxylesterase